MAIRSIWCAALAALYLLSLSDTASAQAPVTVKDAVEMQRIPHPARLDDEIAHFSPDGARFVSVVWRGDLARDVNIYSLLLFDLRDKDLQPRTVLTAEFAGHPQRRNQLEGAISQITFLNDNRTVAFVGTLRAGQESQVYTVDTETREIRQITHHPTSVRSYGLSADGQLRAFSAMTQPDGSECRKLFRSGVSLFDKRLGTSGTTQWTQTARLRTDGIELMEAADVATRARCEAYGWSFQATREYFLVRQPGGAIEPLLDDASQHAARDFIDGVFFLIPDIVTSPDGRWAILYPWRKAEPDVTSKYRHLREKTAPSAMTLALIDLQTKMIRPLTSVPIDLYEQRRILWSRDGRSVITRSMLPLDASDEAANERRASLSPQLVEIDVQTGHVNPIESALDAEPIAIGHDGQLLVRDGTRLLRVRKRGANWGDVTAIAQLDTTGLNTRYRASTNGAVVIGVRDGLMTPPEIALFDPMTRGVKVVTDLNPALRERAFGSVEKTSWKGRYDSASFGYLIKPVGMVDGRRYPLVILLKDSGASPSDDSFLIDGMRELSGHGAQVLAGLGFVVLFTPSPPSFRSTNSTPEEGPSVVAHVESAIDYLDGLGLIDRTRVAIAGWSRAAFHTDYVLMHSRYPFRAGIAIDGGANYPDFLADNCRLAALDDERCELNFERLNAPRLSQQHGAASFVNEAILVGKLKRLGKAVDIYFYGNDAHNLQMPARRHHSLTLNVDWYRFWLQDYEDPDPAKKVQYERWRDLRRLRDEKKPR